MNITRVNIGEIIEQIVIERGLSKAQFASKMGIARQNVVKTIFEKHSLDSDVLCRASEVLDCNLFNYFKCNIENDITELKATLTIELGKETKDRTFRFVFGKNHIELK